MPLEPSSYAVPQNPNASLMDYRIQGPMAGLMVGEQEAALDKAKAQQQIQNNNANAINDILVSQAQKDIPLADATRENKLAEQAFVKANQQQIDEDKVMKLMLSKSEAEQKMAAARGAEFVGIAQQMPTGDYSPGAEAKYQALLRGLDPKTAAKLPPKWGQEAEYFIKGKAAQGEVIQKVAAEIAKEEPKLKNAKEIATAHDETLKANAQLLAGNKGTDDLTTIRETRAATNAGQVQSIDDVTRSLNAINNTVVNKDKITALKTKEARDTRIGEISLMRKDDNGSKYKALAAQYNLPDTAEPSQIWEKEVDEKVADIIANTYANQFPKAIIRVGDKTVKANSPEGKKIVGAIASDKGVTEVAGTGNNIAGVQQPANGLVAVQIGNKTYQVKPEDVEAVRQKYATKGVTVKSAPPPASGATPPPQDVPPMPTPKPDVGDQVSRGIQQKPAYNPSRGQKGQSKGLLEWLEKGINEVSQQEAEKLKQKYK